MGFLFDLNCTKGMIGQASPKYKNTSFSSTEGDRADPVPPRRQSYSRGTQEGQEEQGQVHGSI